MISRTENVYINMNLDFIVLGRTVKNDESLNLFDNGFDIAILTAGIGFLLTK